MDRIAMMYDAVETRHGLSLFLRLECARHVEYPETGPTSNRPTVRISNRPIRRRARNTLIPISVGTMPCPASQVVHERPIRVEVAA